MAIFNFLSSFSTTVFIVISQFGSSHGQGLSAVYLDVKLPTPTYCQAPYYDGQDSIYLFGGCTSTDPPNQLISFSISSQTVQVLDALPGLANWGTIHGDNHGNIFYFGGGSRYNEVFKYDPKLNSSTIAATLPFPIFHHTSFKYPFNNTVYILGPTGQRELLSFDMDTLSSSLVGTYSISTPGATSVLIGHYAYLFDNSVNDNQQAIQLDLESLRMQRVGPPSLPVFSYNPSSVWDGLSQYIYIVGGYAPSEEGYGLDGIFQFDSESFENIFIPVANLIGGNENYTYYTPASVLVPGSNRIYCFGGGFYNATTEKYYDDIFYIDLTPLTERTTMQNSSINSKFSCSNRRDGIYPHPMDNLMFIECLDGMALH